ncbi:MAG: hypothetical protein VYC34_02185 [Planctomycetota bacterium]|nr:hypothetical protein [Planctomycetota bacterium]
MADNPYDSGAGKTSAGGGQGRPFDEREVFVAPPSADDEYVDLPEPPKWPKVVGIISIVWASLGLLCGGCGAFSLFFSSTFQDMVAQGGPVPPNMQPGALQVANMILSIGVAVLLLVAGILCANRKPVARPLHLAYGGISILLLLWAIKIQMDVNNQMAQWVKDNPDSPFAQQFNPTINLVSALAAIVIIGLPWPIFSLIWFGFVKRNPDDFTGGIIEPAA